MAHGALTTGAWVRATWLGWLLGIPCVIVLALLGEAVGVGGTQCLVGAGIGAGVGLWQSYLVHSVLARPAWWILVSFAGWLLAAGAGSMADVEFRTHRVAGLMGALIYLGVIACGGLALGLVTAPLATRMRATQDRSAA